MLLHPHISAHLDLPLHHGHLLFINIKDITMVTGQNLMMVYIFYLFIYNLFNIIMSSSHYSALVPKAQIPKDL